MDEEPVSERRREQILLRERIKELRCLYRVLELTTDDSLSVEQVLAGIVAILAPSLLHDDIAVARIVIDGTEQRSANWREPLVTLSRAIHSGHREVGVIEVGYVQTKPAIDSAQGPFLTEEEALLDGVAVHIGRMLHDRRVAESLAQADRLNAIGKLTGGVAHDFNNLLTVIQGNAELLMEELVADRRLRQLAEMIDAAAERGSELTRGLLAFARRQALEPRPVDVGALIRGMDELLRRSLGEHIEIELVRGAGLWPALVDATQLESAVLNLCLNARDAMSRGGRLTIECTNVHLGRSYVEQHDELTPGQYVMVAVSDTGTGIAPEHLSHVVEPFFTTKTGGRGSGLGLSMVYGFVRQSRGNMKIYSEPAEGTTVRMYLPRADQMPQPESDPEEVEAAGGGSELILLVEDDDLVRRYVRQQVASLGYDVVSARNGPEAMEILRRRDDIVLLFTDIVMPGGMSGRDLAHAAQALRPSLRVLYTSGYSENAIVHHGRLDPGVRMLSKPYRRNDLAAMLRAVLDEE